MASYGDAMVATGALLSRLQIPGMVQGFWTELPERKVLPTALAIIGVQSPEKDLLGRWKPEGSDIYARSYGGRVAKLQTGKAMRIEGDRALGVSAVDLFGSHLPPQGEAEDFPLQRRFVLKTP